MKSNQRVRCAWRSQIKGGNCKRGRDEGWEQKSKWWPSQSRKESMLNCLSLGNRGKKDKLMTKDFELAICEKYRREKIGYLSVYYDIILSHILYGLPVWGVCISHVDASRINKVLFKVMCLHCFDFKREKTNLELCTESGLRNFPSLRIVSDTTMLHRLCHKPESSSITARLIQQSFTNFRNQGRIYFFDDSRRKVGRTSFINRAKAISELIPFPWPDLSFHAFKKRIKISVPILIHS